MSNTKQNYQVMFMHMKLKKRLKKLRIKLFGDNNKLYSCCNPLRLAFFFPLSPIPQQATKLCVPIAGSLLVYTLSCLPIANCWRAYSICLTIHPLTDAWVDTSLCLVQTRLL